MARKKTVVLNLKNLPSKLSDPLYIGRGSFWGNPYVIGKDGDREEVLKKFRRHLWNRKDMLRKLPELKGKQLLCFCAPEKCHGHVLVAALAWAEAEAKTGSLNERDIIPPGLDTVTDPATQQALRLHDAPAF